MSLAALAVYSITTFAVELPPIFYPLTLQTEGKFLAAKQLFPGEEGGLWSIDVHDKVRFFDGSRFVELSGASFNSRTVTFADGRFWYARGNQLLTRYPLGKEQVAYQVEITGSIKRIGHSGPRVWFADQKHLYVQDINSQNFSQIDLAIFERFYSGSNIDIRAVLKVDGTWFLGTNVGVFKWQDQALSQLKTSHRGMVTELFYSSSTRQLLIGYSTGVEQFSLVNQESHYYLLNRAHVLTLQESTQYFWVGTEHGLFLIDKATYRAERVEHNINDKFSLSGEKIYSLVSDKMDGMWIATDNGMRYFSEYGDLFRRFTVSLEDELQRVEAKLEVVANPLGGYWVITPSALYSIDRKGISTLVFWGRVSSLTQQDKQLWLATDRGLLQLDLAKYRVTAIRQDIDSIPTHVDHLAIGSGNSLWLSDGLRLMSVNTVTKKVTDFGDEWVVSKHLPAKITEIEVVNPELTAVGTDHGLYLIENGKSHFIKQSEPFGSVIEISSSDEQIWVASGYGAFSLSLPSRAFRTLPLFHDNIRPVCITQADERVWLVTSAGISAYSTSGDITKHFSAPYGLINNEFINGSCSYSQKSDEVIVGSRYGIVEFSSKALLDAQLPLPEVLVSKVSINNQPIHLGGVAGLTPKVEFGDSIALQLGLWPFAQGNNLVYRIGDSNWQQLQGQQLNIDKPKPGKQHIEIAISGEQDSPRTKVFEFYVLTPWYMTGWFYTLLGISFVCATAMFIYWRSRRIQAMNTVLKTQVALKTEQLQHQSRVLVGNNQQLRKAFNIRHQVLRELTEQAISHSKQFKLENSSFSHKSSEASESLKSVRAVFEDSNQKPMLCSVTRILKFTLAAWQKELDSYGINVELVNHASRDIVLVDSCDLDIIFNSILANAMRRLVRGQVIRITLDDDQAKLSVCFEDSGLPLPNFSESNATQLDTMAVNQLDFSPSSLPFHIHHSGGELKPVERNGRNRITMRWTLSGEQSTTGPAEEKARSLLNPETETSSVEVKTDKYESWKRQVTQLVSVHFNDPDFSTATASKSLFISERSFQRRFKSLFGATFTDYLTDVRMEKACEMLLQGEKVADVAFACGFNDPSYFSQRFKLYFGLPPSKFAAMDIEETSD
ncbi:helix-turn-helix domain-containing protein [Vibrio mediterranei]|uniref:AraC family transcriptional regulator n=1 Tax=Vibrio TaxID=662 RepID=UPI001EFDEBAB|nr:MULTISPECIES: AraC family transcriptional regulator [Vibrio]MCG9664488.1 helix-turn-helix domain-containing protein [Vibrio mediterranei]USE01234.1 helix-turn-helix domain-containing protein [Vibrio sp. SCSIO 43133]